MKTFNKLIVSIIFTALILFMGIKFPAEAKEYSCNLKVIFRFKANELVQPELQNYKLIASVPAKGVFVYGKKLDDRPYFEQVLVKTPTAQREFNWKVTTRDLRLVLSDITGDGQEELVLISVTAYGTGFIETKTHVTDMSLKREIPVEDPVEASQRLIKPSIQGQEIVFSADGKEYRVKPKTGAGGIQREFSNLSYGSIVSFAVENNRLKATVTVGTPYNPVLGEFALVYSYSGGKLVPNVVNFISLI